MAKDINEELSNVYNAAKQAINDDLKLNFYNAAQARNQAFRQLNNQANAQHAMYSGMPAGLQMQYDQQTYLPGAATAVTNAIAKQQSNQEQWDKYMDYVTQLNDQANYYRDLANQANASTSDLQNKLTQAGVTTGAGGYTQQPTVKQGTSNRTQGAINQFSGGGGGW